MSKPVRKTLAERNAEAIAAPTPDPAPAAPAPSEKAARTRPAASRTPKATTATKAPAMPTATSDSARIGIYFHPEQFDIAKAGYLADWTAGGQADTFARWIAGALDEHANRTPQQRAQVAEPQERSTGRGDTRSFKIPADTVARMRRSITEDQGAGRWPSDSAWCGEAITAAAEQARQRAGGVLPTPPARLPNRLAR